MTEERKELLAFNRGVIDSRGLARIDLERMAMSAETQHNWIPRVLGSMMLRPGWEFLNRLNNDVSGAGRLLPFSFGADDNVLLEMSDNIMRVIIDDALLMRAATTGITLNSSFTSNITSWVDDSDAGGAVTWLVGGYAGILGDGTDFGKLSQTVTITESGVKRWLLVKIVDGPVRFKIGSLGGDDDLFAETRLDRGEHHLAFTPTSDWTVEFANEREFNARITQCSVQTAAGAVSIATPWGTANLPFLRWDQSGDVIYTSCLDVRTQKIERRGTGESWSVVDYLPEDGPFRTQNVSGIQINASALFGDITLTASDPFFKQEHADNRSIFRVASQGQTVSSSISAQNIFTDPIRITGSSDAREFSIIVEGIVDSTVTLQFAFTDGGPWTDLSPQYTVPVSTSYNDGQDGQIIYYRLGIKTGDYGTDTVTCSLNYTGGSIQGLARVIAFTSTTVVDAQVLKDFGSIDASKDWWEGEWSDRRGWPTAVGLFEGRLWWAGLDKIWGSISDAYESFDDNTEGDSGPVARSIGFGPIRVIHWILAMGRLLLGTSDNSANIASAKLDGNSPLGARSNSFDEPLTPFNFNIKTTSSRGVFVDRTKQRLYEMTYNLDEQDYKAIDLSIFTPDFNVVGITQIAVQMKPDVRIHCVRSDGSVGILIFDRLENVICWIDVDSTEAGGLIEDVAVLPGIVEDQVYYIIKRTINAGTQRHICKWAMESECVGGLLNKQADSFVTYVGVATVTPFTTELLHLRGETVVIWADGIDVGTDVVTAAGALTSSLATAAANVVAGLSYTAQFKSAKLAELSGIGLLERKKVNQIGFIAENMHYQGLQYGADFNNLSDLPKVSRGQVQSVNQIYSEYHEDNFPFGGTWDEDARICLQAAAPRPCTIKAVIAEMQSVEHKNPRRAPRRS